MIKREIETFLNTWVSSPDRKPLVIRGARQVGKTHSVRRVANELGYHLIELNLDLEVNLHTLFSLEPARFFMELSAIKGINLKQVKPFLFIDEIQAYPPALKLLRYFKEQTPEIPVVAAGSLLDFALKDYAHAMPVGRIDYLYLFPLNFYEFIRALEGETLATYWEQINLGQEASEPLHNKLLQLLRVYYFVGGMPEAVANFVKNRSYADVHKIHSSLLQTYESDFAKYAGNVSSSLIRKVYNAIPAQIGRKIKYVNISSSDRSEHVKKAIELLVLAGVINLVYRSAANRIPLGAEVDTSHFKALFIDIGLVHHILGLRLHDFSNDPSLDLLITSVEGAMAEQFVAQEFLANHLWYEKKQLYYWQREAKNSNAELDYVDAYGATIIPCEVKAGTGTTLRSLHVFAVEKNCSVAVRLWIKEQQTDIITIKPDVSMKLVSLPLYLAGKLFGRRSIVDKLGAAPL